MPACGQGEGVIFRNNENRNTLMGEIFKIRFNIRREGSAGLIYGQSLPSFDSGSRSTGRPRPEYAAG